MKKLITIIAGDPKSINAEIILKAYKKTKKKFLIIGDKNILKKQFLKLKNRFSLNVITNLDKINNNLNILNVKNTNLKSSSYILDCFEIAHDLAKKKKINGFINAPVNKKILKNKYHGITEYLAKKNNVSGKEIMMIYNSKLAVVPLTTHIPIKLVNKKIKTQLILNKISRLSKYYKKLFNKKPKIAILGLNPHNDENRFDSVENKIIIPAIKKLKNKKISVKGPFPADTAFNKNNRKNYFTCKKEKNSRYGKNGYRPW